MRRLMLLLICIASCRPQPHASLDTDARGRYLFGLPAPYTPDPTLATGIDHLKASIRARRSAAWQTANRIFAPAPGHTRSIPSWLTWYDSREVFQLHKIVQKLKQVSSFGSDERISNQLLDQAEALHHDRLLTLPGWDRAEFEHWQNQFDTAPKFAGTGGLPRALYNRAAARHIIQQHKEIAACDLRHEASCQVASFPIGSAIVKASWRRLRRGHPIDTYLTDSEGLSRSLAVGSWLADRAVPSDEVSGYTIELGDAKYLLAGLHVMTKDLQDWHWTTLWWSDDARSNFGKDRLPSTNSSLMDYKMCTVIAFDDTGSANDADGDLGDALQSAYEFQDASWCSNPYLEHGQGNSRTNCIGCHQYAGTGLETEGVLRLQDHGNSKTLQRFATDYVFGLTMGPDNLARKMRLRL